MKIICRKPVMDSGTQEWKLTEIDINDVLVGNCDSIMSIDGSITCTGTAILDRRGMILYLIAFKRSSDETAVQYKVRWKKQLDLLFRNNRAIKEVYYEEPYLNPSRITSTKVLFMLRTSVEELIEENSPDLNYLKLTEVNNKRWKKLFLAPDKCPNDTDLEKKAVRDKLVGMLPILENSTQDEMDASALGFVAVWQAESHKEDLKSRKAARPFQYNIRFIGTDSDDDVLDEVMYLAAQENIPDRVVANSAFYSLPGTGRFEDYVYKAIGEEDALVVLSFDSGKYGNIVLANNIGNLTRMYDRIHAVCWRKNRKRT